MWYVLKIALRWILNLDLVFTTHMDADLYQKKNVLLISIYTHKEVVIIKDALTIALHF